MAHEYQNNVQVFLGAPLSDSATSAVLEAGSGAGLGDDFPLVGKVSHLDPTDPSIVLWREIINITNEGSDIITITRAYETCPLSSTSTALQQVPQEFDEGDIIEIVLSKKCLDDIEDGITARLPLAGGQMTGPINQARSSSKASATTTDLSTMTGDSGDITGTTTIVSFGTAPIGTIRDLTFTGILTITHHATSMILPAGGSNIITAVGDSAKFLSLGSGNWKCLSYQRLSGSALVSAATITGEVRMWTMGTPPSGFLLCDGSAVSRATYANLFDLLNPSLGNPTMTLASPCVVTLTAHGLTLDDTIYFTTTGALPTGVSANTIYYVISAGLTANTFQFSASKGGAAINSSVSQSGTHTVRRCPYGLGNGSTTFNVPNLKGKIVVGLDASQTEFDALGETGGAKTHSLTPGELAAHTHGQRMPATTAGAADTQMVLIGVGGAVTGSQMTVNSGPTASKVQISTDSAGSGTGHNNLQPYVTMNYIIAV